MSSDSSYVWCNDISKKFLGKDYLLPGETLHEVVTLKAKAAEKYLGIPGFADKFISYFQKGWYSFSTPVWVNFGTDRGLPISCFGSYIEDSMESILTTHAEVGTMSKYGGGTSIYLGNLRGRGAKIRNNGESAGAVNFAQLYDRAQTIINQGSTRRGSTAGYLPIDHPDIHEWLQLHLEGSSIQDLSWGVCVPDYWLKEMIAGDMAKREIWAKVLRRRSDKGFPYIFFTDNANNQMPQWYKDQGYRIVASNLCSEIMLPSGPDESFVCDLGSMNLLHYDEWKGTDAVQMKIMFLDAVMSEFIEKASKIKFMERPVKFARRHRALGLGVFGWHSLLQSKMIAYESMQAKYLNVEIFKHIRSEADKATMKLAEMFGEPEVMKGTGRRNSTLLAIAPTKSSSTIIGQPSENTEPYKFNYGIDDKAKVKFTFINPYLKKVLEAHGKDDDATWKSIMMKRGSVQHLPFLTEQEKAVFKTFIEISQMEVVIQAAQRQKYIDQGQSLNLMIHPSTPAKDVNALVLKAWELGVKALYYQVNVNAAQELSTDILSCSSCE